ncbi:Rho guanine nucleotide exchange factor scd1 [Yarrowia sp. C11]|nr:Rho guanine nucleotide exchange factor scd1 [Yarrowia sp. E02]KAG5371709.1 Rho guanine nucleotide exchange factor scd1 [Yarrowia sp. C11]
MNGSSRILSPPEDNLAHQQALHQQIHNLLPSSPYTKSAQQQHKSPSQSTPSLSTLSPSTPRLRSITPTVSMSSAPSSNTQNSVAPMPVANLVMNRQADSDKSLYNMCKTMRDRFRDIELVRPFLEDWEASSIVPITHLPPSIPLDPVTQLWSLFRLGAPLCILFNMLQPRTPLTVDPHAAANRASIDVRTCKRSVYDFVQGCKAELGYSDDELFTISNLFSENTGDLIKVMRTVNMVVETLEARHLLPPKTAPTTPPATRDARYNVVQELLQTERKYVQDLEVLHDYQNRLLDAEILNPDTIHLMFLNVSALVDFQRRVLVGIEHVCSLPVEEQRFGALFLNMEAGFHIYEPYALNQKASSDLAVQEAPNLSPLAHIIEPTYELQAFLIKPIQRICKYPLLLRELVKVSSNDHPYAAELLDGLEAIKRVTNSVNETQRRVENVAIIRDLCDRCDDWKGHNLDVFGDLLYEGIFMVAKGDVEREYQVYLFETIILCCKENSLPRESKKSSKTMSLPSKRSRDSSSSQPKPQLTLKGRIYIANVSNVESSMENGYFLTISWTGCEDHGSFTMRFRHEEQLRQWEATVRQLVNSYYQESYESHFSPLVESPISSRNSQQSSHLSEDLDRLTLGNRSLSGPVPKLGPRQPSTTSINGMPGTNGMMNHSSVSIASSNGGSTSRARSASTPGFEDGSSRPTNIKVRVQYFQDAFTLIVPAKVSYDQLIERVERKVRLCGKVVPAPLRIKYQDEDGDMVTIHSDEDISMALEQKDLEQLNIWVA